MLRSTRSPCRPGACRPVANPVAVVVQKSGRQAAALADADMPIGFRPGGNPHVGLPRAARTPALAAVALWDAVSSICNRYLFLRGVFRCGGQPRPFVLVQLPTSSARPADAQAG